MDSARRPALAEMSVNSVLLPRQRLRRVEGFPDLLAVSPQPRLRRTKAYRDLTSTSKTSSDQDSKRVLSTPTKASKGAGLEDLQASPVSARTPLSRKRKIIDMRSKFAADNVNVVNGKISPDFGVEMMSDNFYSDSDGSQESPLSSKAGVGGLGEMLVCGACEKYFCVGSLPNMGIKTDGTFCPGCIEMVFREVADDEAEN